ncbi:MULTISPECIES: hypothetical protein [unclassified Paenibacillus]|nr:MULTISPECIES: hypothetical protein [unclassified Paenibacillus]SLK08363.1 hypothetical protein SAMN06272722_105272 [Paenibacillus sp. RU5A]SOC71023.1 hypothetical protein SAMN05880581_105270 [Paenibacillus sp. RU26A]SOC73500.1 hypothetical protein SAMN05880586_105271 [Paenibacillus sp. RU5M]
MSKRFPELLLVMFFLLIVSILIILKTFIVLNYISRTKDFTLNTPMTE